MDLSARKQAILSAIVRYHIATGEPIGSKMLAGLLPDAPSPATLRNEMSELCESGYLEQPHTSAGRVPTGKGYRFYVHQLKSPGEVEPDVRRLIDQTLAESSVDPQGLSETAGALLIRLTGLPSVTASVVDEITTVKRVEVFPMSLHLCMLVVAASDGRTRSRLCRSNAPVDAALIGSFRRVAASSVEGKELRELTPAYLQNVAASAGSGFLSAIPLYTVLCEMLRECSASDVRLSGESRLFALLKAPDQAKRLISRLESRDFMLSYLEKATDPINVLFGNDSSFSEMEPSTAIVARFGTAGNAAGRIGVIGPNRMPYERIIPRVAYIAKRLSDYTDLNMNDMEG